jgi:hypothetical protein
MYFDDEIPAYYQLLDGSPRGGYCFELNGAFHWLLKNLGYRVGISTEFNKQTFCKNTNIVAPIHVLK